MSNNFYINNFGFRPPNKIQVKFLDTGWIEKWEGMDGTTNFDKIITGQKKEYILDFDYLNRFEFEFLNSYINNGFWLVECNQIDSQFKGQYMISLDGYKQSYMGGKSNITITLTPETKDA
jgi:hypothetical protein